METKTTVSRKDLLRGLRHLRVSFDNPIRIEGTDGDLSIHQTCTDRNVTLTIPCHCESFSVSVLAKDFIRAVRAINAGDLKLQVDDEKEKLILSDDRSTIGIRLQEVGAQSEPIERQWKPLDISVKHWRGMAAFVLWAASKDDSRPSLMNIQLSASGGKIRMVATDGCHLALAEAESNVELEPVVIDSDVFRSNAPVESFEYHQDSAGKFATRIILCDKEVKVAIQSVTDQTKFPNYQKVVGTKTDETTQVNRKELLAAIGTVRRLLGSALSPITLERTGDDLFVTPQANFKNLFDFRLSVKATPAVATKTVMNIDGKFLRPLHFVPSDNLTLHLSNYQMGRMDLQSPLVVTSEADGVTYELYVMPMRQSR